MTRGQCKRVAANATNTTLPPTSAEHLLEAIPSTSLANTSPAKDQADTNQSAGQDNTQHPQQNQQSDTQNVLQNQATGKALADGMSQEDFEEDDEEEADVASLNQELQSLRHQNAMQESYKKRLRWKEQCPKGRSYSAKTRQRSPHERD